jgi:hypothetical protein
LDWKKRSTIIVGVLAVLYTIVGFLVIPLIAESILPGRLTRHLNRPAEVEDISLNPYTLALSVEGLEIEEKAGEETFFAFDRFFVDLQWVSLFHLAPVCKAVELENPLIRLARVSETEFNFSDLIAKEKEQEPEEQEKKEPFRFNLANIEISGGRLIFRDEPVDKTHTFSDINFTLPHLSNFEPHIDTRALPQLAGDFNDTELQADVSTMPFADSLQTVIDISLTGVFLPWYFAYVPVPLGFWVEDGRLDVSSRISFSYPPEGGIRLEVSGTADLADLALVDREGTQFLAIPKTRIQMAPSQPLKRTIRIETFTLTEPAVTLLQNSAGQLNLARLGPPPQEGAPKVDSPPFVFELGRLEMDSGSIRFLDYAAPSAAKGPHAGPVETLVEAVNLEVSDFSNQAGKRANLKFSAGLDPDAKLSITGNFGLPPLAADLDLELTHLDLTRAQAYFPNALHLALSDGRLNLSGHGRIHSDPDAGFTAGFTGRFGISDFLLLEKKGVRNFTEWKTLELKALDISWNPTHVKLKELALDGLRQTVVVDEDGTLNLLQIYETQETKGEIEQNTPVEKGKDQQTGREEAEAEAASGDEGAPPFPISVDEVSLTDLAVSFTDRSITPQYASRLTLDEGSIQGLSTKAFEGAQVDMKGAVNKHAPVTVAGKANPLLEDLFLDIRFDLENLAMPPLSGYSGKYIGQAIEKGKLNLNLDYRIKNRKLEAENEILLDQFTLGRQVESDAALNLPVGLAVALLKDRKGRIDIDLPVSGRLDDPEFSLGGIILQALMNIITKAATSPFALVGSIVGGGEELRYIEFDPGGRKLSEKAREKLTSMQKLLYERPNLNLELTGYVDEEKDRQALAGMLVERKIRAARRADQDTKKDKDRKSGKREGTSPTDEEYGKYLRRVYKEEVLTRPDALENAKPLTDESLSAEEMKERIRQQIAVTDARLRLLAQNRVQTVENFVLRDERITPKRIFVRQADALSPPEPGDYRSSRVELDLR